MHKAGGTGDETESAATLSVYIRNNIFIDTHATGTLGELIEFSLKKHCFLRQIIGFSSIQTWMSIFPVAGMTLPLNYQFSLK